MKKSVCIVTIIDKNYGNRLQNYALSKKLHDLGYSVRTIPNCYPLKIFIKYICALLLSLYRKNFKQTAKNFLSFLEKIFLPPAWKSFNQLIPWEKRTAERSAKALAQSYDACIVGSDQIWNCYFFPATDKIFLTFAPLEKRIAYAASLGVYEFPVDQQERYQRHLQDFPHISVREHAGAAIIARLTGKSVPVVLDPTMLLTADDWRAVMRRPAIQPKQRYILKYFLGSRNPDYENYISQLAREKYCTILDINQPGNKTIRDIGPAEFVSLIEGASFVCTDSFHGGVFSILFQKPFMIFSREGHGCNMNSRMDTLFAHFELNNRIVHSNKDLANINWDIPYDNVNMLLDKKRRESEDFLKTALETTLRQSR